MANDKLTAVTIILGLLTNIERRLDKELGSFETRIDLLERQLAYIKGMCYAILGMVGVFLPILYVVIELFIRGG